MSDSSGNSGIWFYAVVLVVSVVLLQVDSCAHTRELRDAQRRIAVLEQRCQ